MVFVHVGAVRVAAQVHKGTDVPEIPGHFFRNHVPQLELPHPRRIDHPTAESQTVELGGGGGVASLVRFAADRLHADVEPGVQRIEQRGLAHPALPGQGGLLPLHQAPQPRKPKATGGRNQQHRVTQLGVQAHQRLQANRVGQVDFVDEDNRLDPGFLGRHQQAVDEVGLKRRLGGAGDDEQLVHIGHDDVFPAASGPAEHSPARLDAEDQPLGLIAGSGHGLEQHAVPGGQHVAFVSAQGFQQPPYGAVIDGAVFGLDFADQPADPQHPPPQAAALIHFQLDWQGGVFVVQFFAHDGAPPGHFAPAA